jgi:hypothetical protein
MSTNSTSDDNVNTPVRVNMDVIEASWSPLEDRQERDEGGNGKMKVRSLNCNTRALRGGDWIFTRRSMMTLSVAWTEHGGIKYGLTVGHAFLDNRLPVGSSVFAFDSDDESMTKRDGTRAHRKIKIGTVKAINRVTDSAIIEIFPNINIDPLAVALSGGDDQVCKITLPRPFVTRTDADASDDFLLAQRLVMFGAARREMIGIRVEATGRDDEISVSFAPTSYVTTEEGNRIEVNGETKLSYTGADCGALYLDENGIARCMHAEIQGLPADNPTVWTSRGAKLQDIVNSHSFYFGHAPNDGVSGPSQSYPISIRLETIIDPETKGKYPIPYFEDEEGDGYIERRALSFSEARRHGIQVYFSDEDDEDDDDDDNGTEE